VSAAVRWRAVAVERKHSGSCGGSSSLVYIFFLCHSPFSPLPPLMASLSLSKKLSPLSVSLPFLFSPLISSVSVCFSSLLSLKKTLLFLSFGLTSFSLQENCRSLPLGLPHFPFQTKTFQLPSSPLPFFSCTPSVFIGRGREGHPALSSHGRAWWHAWGRLLHSRPCLCRAWPFCVRTWWCQ